MKIAICGSGPLGLEMAIFLNQLGAEVALFGSSRPGGSVRRLLDLNPGQSMNFPFHQLTTPWGRELAQLPNDMMADIPSVKQYWEHYLSPLIENTKVSLFYRPAKVLRVHKRFLGRTEQIEGHSRLFDLFRVIYQRQTSDDVLEQMKTSPEVFEKLGKDILESLHEPLEAFEDFDLVIEATGVFGKPFRMGPSGVYALNEKNIKKDAPFFYGRECFENLEEIKKCGSHIVIVGSGLFASYLLKFLHTWLSENDSHKVTVITSESTPFEGLKNNPELANHLVELDNFIEYWEKDWQTKCDAYALELHEWRNLESYMKAKIAAPLEPEKKLAFYNGHNVTAVDRLLDREGYFLTSEKAPFRDSKMKEELKTFSLNAACVMTGFDMNTSLAQGLELEWGKRGAKNSRGIHPELGYYTLGPVEKKSFERYTLKEGLEQIQEIEKDIMSFFSRV